MAQTTLNIAVIPKRMLTRPKRRRMAGDHQNGSILSVQ